MKNSDINRFNEMKTFVDVVEQGSFSAAARYDKKSPSSISKLIARLEARLSTRLFNRSTRGLQLTEEGNVFYQQSTRVLSNLEEAERSVLANQTPTGHLRISANIPVGRQFLLPLIPEFLKTYPDINLNITLTDTVINLMDEHVDIAIRFGQMKDSSLLARKLGESSLVVVGSRNYFNHHSIPQAPKDLQQHNLLRFNFFPAQAEWSFVRKGQKIAIKPKGNVQVSDGESMRQLVLNGAGLARVARFQVQQDIDAGKLIPVLEDYNPMIMEPLYAVFLGQGRYLPARIRVFLEGLSS